METTVDYGAPKGALEVIAARRSVRKYLEKPVENEKVLAMLRAGMAAPSGKDLRPWEFVMVTESVVLQAMAAGLPYAKMLAGAPLAIVVCGDTARSAYWYLDCSAAAQNVLLAAEAQGLGAVWTAAYPYDDRVAVVREALHLPENVVPLCVIPVGYPATNAAPKDKFNFAKVHHERY
ncbi:MAG: nitroreductase family protein [Odoribacteraceae bacterium]|nr:nitroreductase family protein [Odoribacteraceae bacterium]